MTDTELTAWLWLTTVTRPAALRALLTAFKLPEAVLTAPPDALATVAGHAVAYAIRAKPNANFARQRANTLRWREQPGHTILTLSDPAYPLPLLNAPDPPFMLYVKGCLDSLQTPSIAIVGSRNGTPQGLEDAAYFARSLSAAGLTIVSGLALGIDGAAHRGTLAAGGKTIAVLGTGADIVYPAQHRSLAQQIADTGAIVSDWPLGTPPRAAHFPQRNRLIAGLARGVLIVEAALRSGSLITARLANDIGRDIFVLPGSIHAPLARGCHRLIKEGAMLVETPQDILSALSLPNQAHAAPTSPASPLSEVAERLLAALGHAPTTLEILAARTQLPPPVLHSTLLQLELAGRLSALPDGRFTRIEHTLR